MRAARNGLVFIAPYDDPYTIAGQGTIGNEILRYGRCSGYLLFLMLAADAIFLLKHVAGHKLSRCLPCTKAEGQPSYA